MFVSYYVSFVIDTARLLLGCGWIAQSVWVNNPSKLVGEEFIIIVIIAYP